MRRLRAGGGLAAGIQEAPSPGRGRPPSPLSEVSGVWARGGDPREGRHSQGPRAPPGTPLLLEVSRVPVWGAGSVAVLGPGTTSLGFPFPTCEVGANLGPNLERRPEGGRYRPLDPEAQEPNTGGPADHLAVVPFQAWKRDLGA